MLREMGIARGQGWLWGHGVDAQEFEARFGGIEDPVPARAGAANS
jgi:EAL domain-containing protein (putative c-di-GMP-specific phosphodiesterase class I)